MKVILLQDIKGTGKKDEIINVSDGFAKNYLFVKNLAVEANTDNLNKLNSKKAKQAKEKQEALEAAKEMANELQKLTVKIVVKAGDNGKIFGGVTSAQISEKLEEQHKLKVDKKKISLSEPIKNVGRTLVDVKLHEGVTTKLAVYVVSE